MYIRKQPSGNTQATARQASRGRGNYEISLNFESNPPIRPAELFDLQLFFKFGRYGYKATGNTLRSRDGKKRVQLLDRNVHIHGARQVQAALLFPEPRRDEYGLLEGRPLIRLKQYIMRHMNFKGLRITADAAYVEFGNLDVENAALKEAIDFGARMQQVEALHDNADKFSTAIARLLQEHRAILQSPTPLTDRAEEVVRELMDVTESTAPDYNVDYVSGTDMIPALFEMLDEPIVAAPIPIESISPEDVEIRRREVAQWRRAAARGPAAAAFRRKVRTAYNSTCIVCGITLPVGEHCRVPGVDSAHILPWATHDMEITANGLCLCKNHHWAFDQGLIAITYDNGQYEIEITDRAHAALGTPALAQLQAHAGPIAATRLPQNRTDWPRPQFLQELYNVIWD